MYAAKGIIQSAITSRHMMRPFVKILSLLVFKYNSWLSFLRLRLLSRIEIIISCGAPMCRRDVSADIVAAEACGVRRKPRQRVRRNGDVHVQARLSVRHRWRQPRPYRIHSQDRPLQSRRHMGSQLCRLLSYVGSPQPCAVLCCGLSIYA